MDVGSIVGCILIIGSIVYFGLYFTVKKATKDALEEFYKDKKYNL